jgi:uncharacterized membrane protein
MAAAFHETLLWVILAMLTFIVFFYSGTIAMSILDPLDDALLSAYSAQIGQ